MTNDEIEDLNTFRHELVKQTRRLQWKVETLEKENEHIKAENAELRERLEKAVDKELIAKYLAGLFGCPCNFSPIDEEMYDYCGEDCRCSNIECWNRVIARMKELKGEKE